MSESATARASSARPDAIRTVTRRVRCTENPAPTAGIRAADGHYPSRNRGNFVAVSRGGGDSAIDNAPATRPLPALTIVPGLSLTVSCPRPSQLSCLYDLGLGGDAGR